LYKEEITLCKFKVSRDSLMLSQNQSKKLLYVKPSLCRAKPSNYW